MAAAYLNAAQKTAFTSLLGKLKKQRLTGDELRQLREYEQLQKLQDEEDGWSGLLDDLAKLDDKERRR